MLLYGLYNRCRIRGCGKSCVCVCMGVCICVWGCFGVYDGFVVMFCREIWHFCGLYEELVFCCCNSFV